MKTERVGKMIKRQVGGMRCLDIRAFLCYSIYGCTGYPCDWDFGSCNLGADKFSFLF